MTDRVTPIELDLAKMEQSQILPGLTRETHYLVSSHQLTLVKWVSLRSKYYFLRLPLYLASPSTAVTSIQMKQDSYWWGERKPEYRSRWSFGFQEEQGLARKVQEWNPP